MRRRPLRTVAPAVAGLALLAGCAALPAVPVPGSSDDVPLVVQPGQATRITDDVRAVVDAYDDRFAADPATADLDALATRVAGPELDLRRAAATIASAGATPPSTGGADTLAPQSSVLPRTEGWPRWFATATEPGDDSSPSLVVLRSTDARTPYTVWATPSLLPGAALPTTGAPADGVAVVGPDEDTNLPASPSDVVDRYADVLLRGDASEFADQFTVDSYREGVTTATASQTEALESAGGSLTQERTLLPDPVLATRTRDGGALVVAGYRWTVTSAGPSGGVAGPLDPTLAALAGRERALEATVVREEVVVFNVPPAGAGSIAVVAVQSGPVSVEAR